MGSDSRYCYQSKEMDKRSAKMSDIDEIKAELRSIRYSLRNFHVDVDMVMRRLGITLLRVGDIENWAEREHNFPHPLFPLREEAAELLARIRARAVGLVQRIRARADGQSEENENVRSERCIHCGSDQLNSPRCYELKSEEEI
ncbi:unnamed protein product [Meloidogyne enterolobii]|uniref:Uncharacterized protein n=2 Tax=Meloidogyne enterolobii TaxID=390850 RepID=A0ACB0XSM2_MELEN|nr:unnamed protein product [Meloidogyne enterolobii]